LTGLFVGVMKILVLSWEFPPRVVGGIARHVAELYPEIIHLGYEIHLITIEFGDAPSYEKVDGCHIYRVSVMPGHDFFQWICHMNQSMGDQGGKLILEKGSFDLVHAHDWLVGDAAVALKEHFKIPLISTIHATEFGRNNGIYNDAQRYIASKENHLVVNSSRIIVCSQYMKKEVHNTLGTPTEKIDVVFNGIRAHKKLRDSQFDYQAFRRRFAQDEEKIVYYVGRITYEKGISVLLNAVPKILEGTGRKTRILIIGGGNTEDLKAQSWNLGIWDQCVFTGFMSDEDLDRFQTVADCAVFPSLYEPFGIVALESFAAKVPVVVSNAGGLPEVVRHNETGIVTIANDPNSLSAGILEILNNPSRAKQLAEQAYEDLSQRFCWAKLAKETVSIYQKLDQEKLKFNW